MRTIDLYTDNYIVNFKDGTQSLERRRIQHNNDINDTLYTVSQGDNLSKIAYKFYKVPRYWFIIADANDIINPLDINIGDIIIIPNLDKYEVK